MRSKEYLKGERVNFTNNGERERMKHSLKYDEVPKCERVSHI